MSAIDSIYPFPSPCLSSHHTQNSFGQRQSQSKTMNPFRKLLGRHGSNKPTALSRQPDQFPTRDDISVPSPSSKLMTARDEAPPAYTASPPTVTPTYTTIGQAARNQVTSTDDDAFTFLGEFDTIFLIDDSGSMAGSNWAQTKVAVERIAPICTKHDEDGLDIHFLNAKNRTKTNITTASAVSDIFRSMSPRGGTLTGTRLSQILDPYLDSYEAAPKYDKPKPINLICITDGDAHDEPEYDIRRIACRLDELRAPAHQIGIQFFQVGNDPAATEFLRKLDDDLSKPDARGVRCRDIVDTVTFTDSALTAEGILKVVLGAVLRRLDAKQL